VKAFLIRYFAKDITSLLALFKTLMVELDTFVEKEQVRVTELEDRIVALQAEQTDAVQNAALATKLKANLGTTVA